MATVKNTFCGSLRPMSHRLALPLALWLCWLPTVAHAGNDEEFSLGNRASMLGGAVAATVDDASAIWYNPGGLGGVERDQLDVTGTVYSLRFYSVPGMLATTQGESRDGSVTEFVALPNSIAYLRLLRPGLTLGYGYFAPHSANNVVRENLDDRNGDPRSQWQIASAVADNQQVFAASIGAALTPRVRLGVSLLGGYSTTLSSVAAFGAVFAGDEVQAATSVDASVTSTQITAQLGAGVQLDLAPQFVLGLALRSPELRIYSSSDQFSNSNVGSLDDVDQPLLRAASRREESSEPIALRRLGRAVVSLAYRYAGGSIALETDLQPGVSGVSGEPDRRFLVNARAGWYQRLDKMFALGVGLLTDRRPEARRYALGSGTADCYGGTLGVELSNEHQLAPGERAKSLIFNTVFAGRYAYCFGDFGRIVGDPRVVSTELFVIEKGSMYSHELSLYMGSGLRF